MDRSVHFEAFASNPERMAGFYASAFGREFRKGADDEFTMADGGIEGGWQVSGRVSRVPTLRVTGTPTMHVGSLDETIRRIAGAGGRLLVPKKIIPGVGFMAYCEDPEGNAFGVFQPDAKAR